VLVATQSDRPLDNPPADLLEVIRRAQSTSAASGGAFDVTIKPVLDLYQRAHANGERCFAASDRGGAETRELPELIADNSAVRLSAYRITGDTIGHDEIYQEQTNDAENAQAETYAHTHAE